MKVDKITKNMLEELDELLKLGGDLIDYEGDIRNGNIRRFRRKLRTFIVQSHKNFKQKK